ncbi:MAG: winged helix-turn-helix domain-containing protein [Actinomycetota bacterium]
MGTTSIVGRDNDLEAIGAHLASTRLVSIVGPGGVGKTTVAGRLFQAVHGPTAWIDLATVPSTGDDASNAVLRALGAPSMEAWALIVADDHPLVVVDNCEHVLDVARHTVTGLLAAHSTVRVLTTSRAELGLADEIRYRLAPLSTSSPDGGPSAAARLFVQANRARGASWPEVPANLSATEDIVRRLDGLPLAIELAAARSSSLAPAEFATMLGPMLDVLHDDLQPVDHQRSLRAVIEASFVRLDPIAQRFLISLSPLATTFDLDLAAAIGNLDRLTALDAVDVLVRESLLVAEHDQDGTTRFRLLEPVREYAYERSVDAGVDGEVVDRFVDALTGIADEIVAAAISTRTLSVGSDAARQGAHIVAALENAVDRDDTPDRAFRLILPLYVPSSTPRELVTSIGKRIIRRWPSGATPGRAEAYAVIAHCAVNIGDDDLGADLSEQVLSDPAATPLGRLIAARALGSIAGFNDDYPGAAASFHRAIEESTRLGGLFERDLRATVLGFDVDGLNSVDELGELAAEAAHDGDDIGLSWILVALINIYVHHGMLVEAERCVDRAEHVSERSSLVFSRSSVARSRAITESVRGSWATASPAWGHCITSLINLGDAVGVGACIRTAAAAAEFCGESDIADALWRARPVGRGNSLLPRPFIEHEHAVQARCGASLHVSLTEAVERASELLSRQPADQPVGSTEVLRFAPAIDIDLSRRQLRRNNAVEHVEPQVFDVLAYLATNAGRMVSREELMDEVWGTRFVTAAAVSSRIRSARAATGDDGKRQAVIRTVHGRGYEFVAEPVGD